MAQAPARRAASESSDVARLVRLHHRRRGWAWVATGSVIGLVVYAGIDIKLFENLTGTAETLSVISVFVLLALALVGLVVVIVDTALIHRADAGVQVSAKGSVSHHPLYAHAHRFPPRHPGSWVAAIFMLVVMTGIAVYILPPEVNSWAYVVGAGRQDTFNPVSYAQVCAGMSVRTGGGCHIVTEGYLSKSREHVTWGSQVPLGQPFSVRDPLWVWGSGRNLDTYTGDGAAIPTIVAGFFFDAVALLLLYILVVIVRGTSGPSTLSQQKSVRDTSSRRSQRMAVPAGADPGAVHQTHHPDGVRRGNGTRSRARRGRGRR
jgi:hypothetical protein